MAGARLEPWGAEDGWLVEKVMGDPAMTQHLGGPESAEKLADRQERYAKPGSGMFKIVLAESGEAVGSVGFWEREWRGQPIYEVGWSVLPAFQGRGIAPEATRQVIEKARAGNRERAIHAFPSTGNAASNAICAKIGFTLLGEIEFEYPKGNLMHCNDWRLEPPVRDR